MPPHLYPFVASFSSKVRFTLPRPAPLPLVLRMYPRYPTRWCYHVNTYVYLRVDISVWNRHYCRRIQDNKVLFQHGLSALGGKIREMKLNENGEPCFTRIYNVALPSLLLLREFSEELKMLWNFYCRLLNTRLCVVLFCLFME